jgi:hypothetical protein
MTEPASFLNLDLELNSATNLGRLAKHLDASAHILYSGRVAGGYRLCAEPLIDGRLSTSLRACTSYFLELLEGLPDDLAGTLQRCKSRLFDYGFDGGLEAKPLALTIPTTHLSRIARLGIGIRITVYPYREPSDA